MATLAASVPNLSLRAGPRTRLQTPTYQPDTPAETRTLRPGFDKPTTRLRRSGSGVHRLRAYAVEAGVPDAAVPLERPPGYPCYRKRNVRIGHLVSGSDGTFMATFLPYGLFINAGSGRVPVTFADRPPRYNHRGPAASPASSIVADISRT